MTTSTLADRLRQPEYTGENRCTPCTVVNVVIAAALSLLLGVAWPPLALVSFALFAGAIYFRGYLIPGTPTLTKTYFPDRVLRWFDKEPTPARVGAAAPAPAAGDDAAEPTGDEVEAGQLDGDGASAAAFDVEAALMDAGALELDDSGDELRLAPAFESAWNDEISRTDEDVARRWLARMTGVDEADVTLESRARSRWVVAMADGTTLGTWESDGALVADVAADAALDGRLDDWDRLTAEQRSALARGVRIYLDRCPTCGGDVRFGSETAESCCRSWEVLAVRCDDCEARLLEVDAESLEPEAA
ncbi:hypothetical protein [Haloferax sp. KTX1]|uniref:hypothetical protein n=1 Tax=Haloferax sp. KTX1 TaxID=2600597 RepID=UPI0011DC83B4|nr:hypothetical protein [Haloferax sp. KTX1]